MSSTRWSRVRAILETALELEGAERAAHLERECGDDHELRREVMSLLDVDASGDELRPPDAAELARALGDPNLGRRIGVYTIERRLGTGGMGVVYLARRTEADFEQRVALKLIKRGMDTEDILRQFRRERALLAGLEHESIARLFDGGSTEDGLPWLAMEYVEGPSIDVWCREQALSIRARIELFVRVTAAVRHAHQRLIVHRDLKPSNILVDARGTPKLLDFGIAKLLDASAPAAVSRTEPDQRRLTPDYASPEQMRGEPVTTATDVYSLGVVLYEILTGDNPLRGASGPQRSDPGRSDPERPSTRAERRHAEDPGAPRLEARELRGDLDTIVLTALAQAPGRRYSSVEALELDLKRFLAGFPIEARPASAGYRLSKFVARHRVPVAAGFAVVASLAIGVVMTQRGYREAVRQRALAEAGQGAAEKQARRAQAVLKLTREMLAGASPDEVKDKDLTLRQLLDDFDVRLGGEAGGEAGGEVSGEVSGEVGGEVGGEPEVEAAVRQIMGRAYRKLGLLDKAERHIDRALELLPGALTSNDETSLALAMEWIALLHDRGDWPRAEAECTRLVERLSQASPASPDLADPWVQRGDLYRHLHRFEEARTDLLAAKARLEAARPIDFEKLGTCLATLTMTLESLGERTAARELGQHALASAREHTGARSAQTARILNNLGHQSLSEGRYADAERELSEAVSIEGALRAEHDPARAPSLTNLGRALTAMGRYEQAEPVLREAVTLTREGLGARHPSLAANLGNLGQLLEKRGDSEGARAALSESLEIRVAVFGEKSIEVARARNNLGVLLRGMGRLEESEQELRRALELRRELLGERDLAVASSLQSLGSTLLARGALEAAEVSTREALSIYRAAVGPTRPELAVCLASLSSLRLRRGDAIEARALAEEALSMRRELLGNEHPDVARSLQSLAEALTTVGEYADAESRLREAEAMQRKLLGDKHASLARTLFQLGDVAERSDRLEDARRYYSETLDIWRGTSSAPSRDAQVVAARLSTLLEAAGELEAAAQLRREYPPADAPANGGRSP